MTHQTYSHRESTQGNLERSRHAEDAHGDFPRKARSGVEGADRFMASGAA